MLKLLVLDWNGTTFDDREVVIGSVDAIFRQYGLTPPPHEAYWREITADFMPFYQKYGIPPTAKAAELDEIRKRYFEEHWNEGRLRDGVKELLTFCRDRGIRTAIVSSEIDKVLRNRCLQFKLTPLLDLVKGDARQKTTELTVVLKLLRIDPDTAVYMDDTYDGIRAAQTAGMKTIGFTAGYNPLDQILIAQPDFPNDRWKSVDSFHTVMDILRLWPW